MQTQSNAMAKYASLSSCFCPWNRLSITPALKPSPHRILCQFRACASFTGLSLTSTSCESSCELDCLANMLKPPVCYRILAANRDEFLARPTTPAAFHNFQAPEQSHPHTSEPNEQKYILSGLDLEGGGTWLGVSRPTLSGNNAANQTRLRFATLTNFTENLSTTPRPSRGKLVKDFLDGSHSLDEYLELMERIKADYAGFNLVLGVVDASGQWQMGYVSNRNDENARRIEMPDDGRTLSVSNSTLSGEVWPKCRQGSTNVSRAVREGGDSEEILTDKLWQALR